MSKSYDDCMTKHANNARLLVGLVVEKPVFEEV